MPFVAVRVNRNQSGKTHATHHRKSGQNEAPGRTFEVARLSQPDGHGKPEDKARSPLRRSSSRGPRLDFFVNKDNVPKIVLRLETGT